MLHINNIHVTYMLNLTLACERCAYREGRNQHIDIIDLFQFIMFNIEL